MANPNPSPETRFGSVRGGIPSGRPKVRWLREKLEVVDPATGQTKLQDIADHLIEVATKWEILRRGENIEVASARDSVEAARLLFQAISILRKPAPSEEEATMQLAEHLRQVSRDQIDILAKVLGEELREIAKDPEKLGRYLRAAEVDPMRFLRAAGEALTGMSTGEGVPAAQGAEAPALPEPPKEGS